MNVMHCAARMELQDHMTRTIVSDANVKILVKTINAQKIQDVL